MVGPENVLQEELDAMLAEAFPYFGIEKIENSVCYVRMTIPEPPKKPSLCRMLRAWIRKEPRHE